MLQRSYLRTITQPFAAIIMLILIGGCGSQTCDDVYSTQNFKDILPARENARLIEEWLRLKKENFIPELLTEFETDMWVVTENDRRLYPFLVPANEDGLVTREPFFLVYCKSGDRSGAEEIHIGNMNNFREWGPLYPEQSFTFKASAEKLLTLIEDKNPGKIALGIEQNPELMAALEPYASRLAPHDNLRNRWIEYRTPEQIEAYKTIVDITHDILAEAFQSLGGGSEKACHGVIDVGEQPRRQSGQLGSDSSRSRPFGSGPPFHIAAADHHIGIAGQERFDKFRYLFRRVAQVGVHDQRNAVACLLGSSHDGTGQSPSPVPLDQDHRFAAAPLPDVIPGQIGRTVIDENDFRRRVERSDQLVKAVHQKRQHRFFVENGKDEAVANATKGARSHGAVPEAKACGTLVKRR